MTSFIVLNEHFTCQNCQHNNEKLAGSCRNHCIKCLFSLHLDETSPGDRASHCLGLMQPISVEQNGKKGWMLTHQCLKCGKEILNKSAPDDNFDEIIKLTKNLP